MLACTNPRGCDISCRLQNHRPSTNKSTSCKKQEQDNSLKTHYFIDEGFFWWQPKFEDEVTSQFKQGSPKPQKCETLSVAECTTVQGCIYELRRGLLRASYGDWKQQSSFDLMECRQGTQQIPLKLILYPWVLSGRRWHIYFNLFYVVTVHLFMSTSDKNPLLTQN